MNFHKPAIDLASTAVGVGLGLVDYEAPQIDVALKNANASQPFQNSRDIIRTVALAGGLLGASMAAPGGKVELISKNLFYEALPLFTESVTNAAVVYTSSSTASSRALGLQPARQAPSQSFIQQKAPLNFG